MGGGGAFNTETLNPDVCYFTREWGDNVDDWYSHNSPSRVNRVWGEVPMLIQAQGYANPDYKYTCYDVLYRTSRQHMGGCLWHSFDHQRGISSRSVLWRNYGCVPATEVLLLYVLFAASCGGKQGTDCR